MSELERNESANAIDWLDTQSTVMRELTETLCNINSYTNNVQGIDKVRKIVRPFFEDMADEVNDVPLPDHEVVDAQGNIHQLPTAAALQAVCRPSASRRLFLCIHLDTVYPPESEFQSCVESSPGILNGPGVIDAKGGAVVLLFALKAFERFKHKSNIGWEVVLNTDEEIGSPASQAFVKERAKNCQVGLLFEPALPDGTLVDQRKGSGNFSIIVRGQSAHSGRDFAAGRNAIASAADLACQLHQLNGQQDGITINVAKIDGGGPFNVVPDLAVVRVNVRVNDREQQQWVEHQLESLVRETDSCQGFSCELHGAFFSPPKIVDGGTEALKTLIEKCASELGLSVGWRSTGGVSDGNKLAAINVPNIDTLGVRGDNMHNPAEYLVIDSLVERAKLTTLILMHYAITETTR